MSFNSLLEMDRSHAYNCQTYGLDLVLPEPYFVPLELHLAFARAFADGVSAQAEIDRLYNQLIQSVWGPDSLYARDANEMKVERTDQFHDLLGLSSARACPITFFISNNDYSHAVSIFPYQDEMGSAVFLVSNMLPEVSSDFGENVMMLTPKKLENLLFARLANSSWGNVIVWPPIYER